MYIVDKVRKTNLTIKLKHSSFFVPLYHIQWEQVSENIGGEKEKLSGFQEALCMKGLNPILCPIPTKGGPFGPKHPKTVWHFYIFTTRVTKIHDFVYFSISLVPVKLFWEKKLWNYEKLKKNILTVSTPKGPPFGKKIEKIKFFVSFRKNHTISTWILIIMFLAFFWGI